MIPRDKGGRCSSASRVVRGMRREATSEPGPSRADTSRTPPQAAARGRPPRGVRPQKFFRWYKGQRAMGSDPQYFSAGARAKVEWGLTPVADAARNGCAREGCGLQPVSHRTDQIARRGGREAWKRVVRSRERDKAVGRNAIPFVAKVRAGLDGHPFRDPSVIGKDDSRIAATTDCFTWWAMLGSNQRPLPCEGSALPLS